jgi:RNA polymerase sigma-70 factor (ECF subfamily)
MAVAIIDPILLKQWIQRAKTGDEIAFERLFDYYSSTVLRTAQRLLLNREDAQDAAQEAFLRLYRSLNRIDQERDVMPWLYRLTVNACQDMRRRKTINISFNAAVESASPSLDAQHELEATERSRLLYEALGSLPERERDAIVLRELEGLTTAQVAAALGTGESTVRSQIAMGRIKLRDYLNRRFPR